MSAAACIYLLVNAATDFRSREISVDLGLLFSVAGGAACGLAGRDWRELAAALLPGMAVLLLSVTSKGAVGAGDGLVIGVLGFFEPLGGVLGSCLYGCFFAGGAALLMLAGGAGKKDTLPFVPWLAAGYVLKLMV